MKKKIIIPLLVMAVLLAACGSSQNNFNRNNFNSSGNGNGNGTGNGQGQATLPLAEKLAVGTLKLENTSFKLTPKQAADLLPLWQVYSSLLTSETAAQEEKDALAQQIQETMTSDQINNINSMNLTQRDIFSSMQELGLFTQQVNANATPSASNNNFGPGGGFPGGGGPEFFGGGNGTNRNNGGTNRNGGSGFGGNGSQLSPQQIATAQARRNANGGNSNSNRFMTPLVTAVIKLLESKVQAYP